MDNMNEIQETNSEWKAVVTSRKKKILPISQDETVSDSILLSDLVKNDACIHCMGGRCRERDSDHNPIPFPVALTNYIKNPLLMKSLDDTLKRHPIQPEAFKKNPIGFTICLFNHCRKACKNTKDDRCDFIELPDGEKLYYCFPPTNKSYQNRIMIGLHIDVQMIEKNKKWEAIWRPFHHVPQLEVQENFQMEITPVIQLEMNNETTKENDEVSVSNETPSSSFMMSPLSVITPRSNKWADIVKISGSTDDNVSVSTTVNKQESEINSEVLDTPLYMMNTRNVQRNTPRQNYRNSPNHIDEQYRAIIDQYLRKIEIQQEMIDELIDLNKSLNKNVVGEMKEIRFHVMSLEKKMETKYKSDFQFSDKYIIFQELLQKCNTRVSEQILSTHYDKYFVFSNE